MSALKAIESKIHDCINTINTKWVELGGHVTQVRDDKIYLEAFSTFEEWCETAMGWTRRRAYQLMAGTDTVNSLPPTLRSEVKTERDARALEKLEPDEQKRLIRHAKKDGVSITEKAKTFSEKPAAIGRNVSTAVHIQVPSIGNVPAQKQVKEKEPEKALVVDETGYPIPSKLHPLWNRRYEIQELMTAVSRVKTRIEKGRAEDDALFRAVSQLIIDQLERSYSFLIDAKPYAVCLTCQGRAADACRVCKGTGLISKFGYETRGDQKVRAIRENGLVKA